MNFTCQDLCFGYTKKSLIFDHYSHVFPKGITVLKGYSGCGKTTLLKIMAGYLPLFSGQLRPPVSCSVQSRRYKRSHVSYMFQGLNLLPLLSIEKNLKLSAELSLLPKKIWQPRMEELLEELGLKDYRHKKAHQLSGGQQQRAALARTLIKHPEVLLLDEPTSGLDDANTLIIKRIIRAHAQHSVCLVSTHDARLLEIADEVLDFNTPVSV